MVLTAQKETGHLTNGMPYALRKAPKRDLYWVVTKETGERHSKDPLPRARAEAQMRALYASLKGSGDCGCGGGADCLTKAKQALGELIVKGGRILKDKEGLGRALPTADIELLLHQFVLTKQPKTLKHLNTFIKDIMKKLDCGCGCEGEKGLTAVLTGGKKLPCPEGFSDNGAGLCVENCKSGEEDTGIECIEKNCPPGFQDSGVLTCYKPPGGGQVYGGQVETRKSHLSPVFDKGWGGWNNTVWQGLGGGDIVYDDCPRGWVTDGALCRAPMRSDPIIPAETYAKKRKQKRITSAIDLEGTFKEIANGLKDLFEGRVDLAELFDPEKNGVAAAFRKFGENSKKAFEEVGMRMLNAFDPNKNGVRQAFEKFGKEMSETIGNKDWWNKTMTDPDTYIFLIGAIASVAATILSAGTAGPLLVIALQALGPATKMIADAARGKPIDGLDVASLLIGMIPIPGAAGASGAAAKAILEKAALGVTAAKALPYVAAAAQVGKIVVMGTQVAQIAGYVPSTCIANCGANTEGDDLPPTSECQDKRADWKSRGSRADPPGFAWTADCPKPPCDKKKWKAATGCAELTHEQLAAEAAAKAQAEADAAAEDDEELDFDAFDAEEEEPLPDGWVELVNEEGETYYVNEELGEETTVRPTSGPQNAEESRALQEAEDLKEEQEKAAADAKALAEAEAAAAAAERAAEVAAENKRKQEERDKELARIAAEDAVTAARLQAYMEEEERKRWAAVQNNPNAPKTDAQWEDYKDFVLSKALSSEWKTNGTGVLGGADLSPQEFSLRWDTEPGMDYAKWKKAWNKTQFDAGASSREAAELERLTKERDAQVAAEEAARRAMDERDRLDFTPAEPVEEPAAVYEGAGRKFERRFGMTSKEFLSLPHFPDMDDVARRAKMKHEDAMEFARSGSAKPFAVKKQMKSQRPALARIQALQRQRLQQRTVKIQPTHLRPNLLGEVPVANSIGTWGGAKTRRCSSDSESEMEDPKVRRGKGLYDNLALAFYTLTTGLTATAVVQLLTDNPDWLPVFATAIATTLAGRVSADAAERANARRVDAALDEQGGQAWQQAQAAAEAGDAIDPQVVVQVEDAAARVRRESDAGSLESDPGVGRGGDRPRVDQQEFYYPQNLDFESQAVVGN